MPMPMSMPMAMASEASVVRAPCLLRGELWEVGAIVQSGAEIGFERKGRERGKRLQPLQLRATAKSGEETRTEVGGRGLPQAGSCEF